MTYRSSLITNIYISMKQSRGSSEKSVICISSRTQTYHFFFGVSSSLFKALASYSVPYHVSQTVGRLGRLISLSQDRYLHTGQHKQNRRIHTPNIYDPSVRASEDSSCRRLRGYRDRPKHTNMGNKLMILVHIIFASNLEVRVAMLL
jgi:hypothetical protein